jgi:ketosteroid isomerase-like protein
MRRAEMERLVRRFYEGCNEGSGPKLRSCLAEDAVHYFPAGASQGIFRGREEIIAAWQSAIRSQDSRWTLDRLLVDETLAEVAVEWTHFKPVRGGYVRGAELCSFDDEMQIAEIRAYYAAPALDAAGTYELDRFDYARRGYATEPPTVVRRLEDGLSPGAA